MQSQQQIDIETGNLIETQVEIVEKFEELNLNKDLLRGIFAYGFEKPSTIQQKAIKPIIMLKDVLAQAQSGTGKTGTFVIGALQRIDPGQKKTQVIILAPVLELAKQIFHVVKEIGQYMNIEAFCSIGGTSMAQDMEKCKQGVHIIIETPERLIDMIKRQYLDTVHMKLLVIDEADLMLDHGFIENILEILSLIPQDVQIALFSTTFSLQIIQKSKRFLRDPVKILIKNEQLTLERIRQFYMLIIGTDDMRDKRLLELYNNLNFFQSIVFCNSARTVDEVTENLRRNNLIVGQIHQSMDYTEREQVMRNFKNGSVRILVTTDLMGRGIDVQQLSLVINYDFPRLKDQYLHRIGRAGRYGRNGVGINMISPAEAPSLEQVENFYNIIIKQMPRDVGEVEKHLNINSLNNFNQKIKQQENICMQQKQQIEIETENLIETQVEIVEKFEELNLNNDLLLGIFAYGFDKPSVILQKTINAIIQGRDVLAQAQSGTGKTSAFVIGALQRINPSQKETQVIILAPAQELAMQIFDVVKGIGQYMNIEAVCCIGDTSMAETKEKCKQGVHIIIATPGRLIDIMKNKYLDTLHLKLLVVDEADQMFDHGFIENIAEILKHIHQQVQIALFSATYTLEVIETAKQFLSEPAQILVKKEQLTLEVIRQFYIAISAEDMKYKTLVELYKNLTVSQSIVFCNSKKTVDELTDKLRGDLFTVSKIHSLMDQTEREQVMQEFKNGAARILVSTDLMGRGIDVQQLSLVINFDFPRLKEQYLHRIGRAGRYGRKGVGINMVSPAEAPSLMEVEKFYNTKIEEMPSDLGEVEKELN